MKYHEILKALIGIPSLSARLDNPFPLVGDKVTISSTSEWVRQHEYLLDGGAGPERSVLDCVLGKSSETVDMSIFRYMPKTVMPLPATIPSLRVYTRRMNRNQ